MPVCKFISITHAAKGLIDNITPTPEELIVYIARVSNPNNQANLETAPKLLKYCLDHKHWSPFEMVDMTVEIQTSRAISAQILRHRSFSFQEFSQRYSEVGKRDSIIYKARRQNNKNRQASLDDLPEEDQKWFGLAQHHVWYSSLELYQEALKRGIAKECARFLLPLNTKTTLYMKSSIRSWIHYLQVRTAEETQLEHREIALEIKEIFKRQFPNISQALEF